MSYAEEASAKDMEVRGLSREISSLRAAAGPEGGSSGKAAAVEASAAERIAVVGSGGKGGADRK